MMLKKLKIKFIVYTMSIFSIIVLIAIGGVLYSIHSDNENKIAHNLQITAAKELGFKPKANFATNFTGKRLDNSLSFKLSDDGEVIGFIYEITDRTVFVQLKELAISESGIIELNDYIFKYITLSDNSVVFVEISEEVNRMNEAIVVSSMIGIGSLLIIFVSSLLLANWALKPVEESWQKQKEFVSNASHELRTPLAVILANASLLKDDVTLTNPDKIKFVDYIAKEARRMSELVERLLFLAKSDQTKQQLNMNAVNLSDVIYEVTLPLESVAFEQSKVIELDVSDNVVIQGDKSYLQQLLIILIDNAIKYSYANEVITIKLTAQGEFSVNNIGNVIPEDKIKNLFERFYRLDESRERFNEDVSGYGLGLSIAKTIAKMHQTKINVVSHPEKGTTFSIKFNK